MFHQQSLFESEPDSKTYPLDEDNAPVAGGTAGAIVALSHSPLERRLYQSMLLATGLSSKPKSFTVRRLMEITEIRSLSTVRRGLEGLAAKHSIERQEKPDVKGSREMGVAYSIVRPEEVMLRRSQHGMGRAERGVAASVGNRAFERVLHKVVANKNLSRREAQVALCCVEGLTNAEIGSRLMVTEQTVKFHLRNIFVKFGVKRRAELISRLLM